MSSWICCVGANNSMPNLPVTKYKTLRTSTLAFLDYATRRFICSSRFIMFGNDGLEGLLCQHSEINLFLV